MLFLLNISCQPERWSCVILPFTFCFFSSFWFSRSFLLRSASTAQLCVPCHLQREEKHSPQKMRREHKANSGSYTQQIRAAPSDNWAETAWSHPNSVLACRQGDGLKWRSSADAAETLIHLTPPTAHCCFSLSRSPRPHPATRQTFDPLLQPDKPFADPWFTGPHLAHQSWRGNYILIITTLSHAGQTQGPRADSGPTFRSSGPL